MITPSYTYGEPKADLPPVSMSFVERGRYRLAAMRALQRYPGPVGEYLARELHSVADFGWQLVSSNVLARLRDELLEP